MCSKLQVAAHKGLKLLTDLELTCGGQRTFGKRGADGVGAGEAYFASTHCAIFVIRGALSDRNLRPPRATREVPSHLGCSELGTAAPTAGHARSRRTAASGRSTLAGAGPARNTWQRPERHRAQYPVQIPARYLYVALQHRHLVAFIHRRRLGRFWHSVKCLRISVHASWAPQPQPQGMQGPTGCPPRFSFGSLTVSVCPFGGVA